MHKTRAADAHKGKGGKRNWGRRWGTAFGGLSFSNDTTTRTPTGLCLDCMHAWVLLSGPNCTRPPRVLLGSPNPQVYPNTTCAPLSSCVQACKRVRVALPCRRSAMGTPLTAQTQAAWLAHWTAPWPCSATSRRSGGRSF